MPTLGLSDTTPRTENRLKSLLWPSVETGSDVDYLGTQGYWMCTLVAVFSAFVLAVSGQPIIAVVVFLFNYLGGVGVRERSRYAAAVVLVVFVLDTLVVGPSVVRVIMGALLLSNLRATWIASRWKPESEEAILPPRLDANWSDKLSDKLPAWLWPKVRMLYYVFSACYLMLVARGMVVILGRSRVG